MCLSSIKEKLNTFLDTLRQFLFFFMFEHKSASKKKTLKKFVQMTGLQKTFFRLLSHTPEQFNVMSRTIHAYIKITIIIY